ncbi:helix-turn-helix domain-containing protein [Streptosporangium sp. NPDC004631]
MPPQQDDQGRDSRTPLSDYVRAAYERSGLSKNAFAQMCVDPQDPTRSIYNQWLDQLMTARGPLPEPWRLRALAAGIGVDVEDLKRLAAAQWLDYKVEEAYAGDDVIMIPVKGPISEATRLRIRRMVELLVEEAGD